jgi:Predicted Zn-dependent proteases and their inactivated homologs
MEIKMISLEGYKKIMSSLPEEIMQAEIDAERRAGILIGVVNGEVVSTDASDITALYVRVSGEKTGYTYTQNLDEDPGKVLLRAYRNGIFSQSKQFDRINTLDTAFYGSTEWEYSKLDISALKYAADKLESRVRSAESHISKMLSEIRVDTFSSRIINSNGVDISSNRVVYSASVKVMAENGGKQYNTSCSISAYTLEALDLDKIAGRVAVSLENQYNMEGFSPGEYPAVLDRTVGINIMTTAWQLFSGLKYFDGSTVLGGKLGEQIGSKAFSVIDVPDHSGTGYRFPFDCEGSEGKKVLLVDKGELTGLLHNISSADNVGHVPTGNAGRIALLSGNIPTDIIVTPKICYIEPGERSAGELLKTMREGIYITSSYDVFHSLNIGSGDFAIPCRGVVIKEGKPQYAVSALTICGNLLDLFKNIEEAADDLLIDEFLLKSYCVGSPSLRLSKLQINGK